MQPIRCHNLLIFSLISAFIITVNVIAGSPVELSKPAKSSQASSRLRQYSPQSREPQPDHLPNSSPDLSGYDTGESTDSHDDDSIADNSSAFLPPTDLSVVRLSDNSVVVRWDISPAVQSQLQFFKIQYKRSSKNEDWKTHNQEISPTARAFQINDLRPGNYWFVVSAVYENDDNKLSEQHKFRLRARSKIGKHELPNMKAPHIYWNETADDYFRFKWKYEIKESDMPYFGYLVYYRPAHIVSDFTIYNTLDENVEVADIEPDTPYEAKVVAYNNVTVSEFSPLITLRTKKQTIPAGSDETTTPNPSTPRPPINELPTTEKPATSPAGEENIARVSTTATTTSTTLAPYQTSTVYYPTSYPRPRPNEAQNKTYIDLVPVIRPHIEPKKSEVPIWNQLAASINEFISGNQNNTTLVILIVLAALLLMIILLIIFLAICRNKRKDSAPSSTTESMQFDLEINGYFKNSFPGVEKEYPPLPPGNANHHAHHGFVNNHPHINDFT